MTNGRYPILLMLILLALCVQVGSASTLSIEDGWVTQVGDSTQVSIWLDEAPEGLSGFNISIALLDPSIGEITDIIIPDWADLTDNSSVPAGSVWIKGAALNEQFPPPSYDIPFGTLTLKGTQIGVTVLNITITQIDDYYGNASTPDIRQGIFIVGEPPIADFVANQTEGFSPLSVQFTDLSVGTLPLSYEWDFGDGTSNVTEQDPEHVFTATVNTTYTVNLKVSNMLGSSSYASDITVNVTPPIELPVANFTANQTEGFSPLPVQFTDLSTGTPPLDYEWDFGDGSPNSTATDPQHLFTTTVNQTFFVVLTVTNDAGSDSMSLPVTVNVTPPIEPPIADFITNRTEGFSPLSVQFTDLSTGTPPLEFEWDFGDGSPFSYEKDPEHTFTTNDNRTFFVTLTVTNEAGSNAISKPITVNIQPSMTASIIGWVATGSGAGAAYIPGARVRVARNIADLDNAAACWEGIANEKGIYYIDKLPDGAVLYATVLSPVYVPDQYYKRPIQYQINWGRLRTCTDTTQVPALPPLSPVNTEHIVWIMTQKPQIYL